MPYDGRIEEPPYDTCESCATLTAERDELQRRLDAVVEMLEPGERPTEYQYAFDLYPKSNFEKALEKWKALQSLYTRAIAIAEGRESLDEKGGA